MQRVMGYERMKIWVDETLEKYGAPNKRDPRAFVIGPQHALNV